MGDEAFRELSKVDPDGGKLLDDVSGCTFIFFLVRDTCRIQFSFHAECFWRSKSPRLAKENKSVFKAHLVPWVEFFQPHPWGMVTLFAVAENIGSQCLFSLQVAKK